MTVGRGADKREGIVKAVWDQHVHAAIFKMDNHRNHLGFRFLCSGKSISISPNVFHFLKFVESSCPMIFPLPLFSLFYTIPFLS